MSFEKLLEKNNELLGNIKTNLPELQKLLDKINQPYNYEDLIYRFYHQSFKVYQLQDLTLEIAESLRCLAPKGTTFCAYFDELLKAGASGKAFEMEHNAEWSRNTRPFVEAFFHARYMLEMAVKYGQELDQATHQLPSGWAALLCLYDIR
jgi:hypothetical protein